MKKYITLALHWVFLICNFVLFFIGTAFFSWLIVILVVFGSGQTPLEKIEQGSLFIRTKVASKEDDFIVTNLQTCGAVDCDIYVYDQTKEVLLEKSEFDPKLTIGDDVIVQLGKPERTVERKQFHDKSLTINRKVFPVLAVQDDRLDLFGLDSYIFHGLFLLIPPVIISSLVCSFLYKQIMPIKENRKK